MSARKIEYNTDKLDGVGTGKHETGVKKFSYYSKLWVSYLPDLTIPLHMA